MSSTASSYFIPHSINAKATKTGALKKKKNINMKIITVDYRQTIPITLQYKW